MLRLLDMAAIDELLRRVGPRRGVRNLRAVLGIAGLGENISRRELEQRFLALCRRTGLPEPNRNAWILLGGEHVQVDFLWRERRVVVETDGYRFHRSRQAFHRDRRRSQLLDLEGWHHTRLTWDDVLDAPEHAIRVVRLLLARAA